MSEVLAITLQGMQQDAARLERISMNMANATTPGYKRELAIALAQGVGAGVGSGGVRTFGAAMANARAMSREPAPTASPGGVLVRSDLRTGTLKATGQSLDVALSTPGFFEVSGDAGPTYTRNGSWHLDERGRLVTAQGHPVMGLAGEIVLDHPNPVIDSTGQVFERKNDGSGDPTPIAKLKVVNFDNEQQLRRAGDGLWVAAQEPNPVADAQVQLHQGFVENSNVNSMHEMVELMQTMRHFESMQRVALGYDDMVGGAVRKLGDLS